MPLLALAGFLSDQTYQSRYGESFELRAPAKPGVLVGGVIDDEVDDDADAALLAAMGEFDEIAERAVSRIDAVIVGDVVAVVLAGRRLERHQPDRGDAEPVQIIQPPQQALEIADAVAVGIHIGADGEAIEHAVLVPEVVDHLARSWWEAVAVVNFCRLAEFPGGRFALGWFGAPVGRRSMGEFV